MAPGGARSQLRVVAAQPRVDDYYPRTPGLRTLALAFALLAYTGCATVHVKTDYSHETDFGRFRTFALEKGSIISQGRPDVRNSLVRDRIDRALAERLSAKGLSFTPVAPDLVVTYVAGARTRQELEHVDWGYPWGPFWGGPGYDDFWVSAHQQGTLVIDLVDADTQKLVWRGMVVAEDRPFTDQAFIDEAVGKVLAQYPPRGS
jgi:hypothetical protein